MSSYPLFLLHPLSPTPLSSLLPSSHFSQSSQEKEIREKASYNMDMMCFKKSQIIMLLLLLALLILTPLLSSSFLRSTYLYFVFNLLIIALGAEAGLLSNVFSKPKPNSDVDPKKQHHHSMVFTTTTTSHAPLEASNSHLDHNNNSTVSMDHPKPAANVLESSSDSSGQIKKKVTGVSEKSASEKVNRSKVLVKKVKKCPSTPSIFFIGSGGDDRDDYQDRTAEDHCEEFEEYDDDDHHQDQLFTKAETFIGNFYKQLQMQREDSWKRIHGIYQNILN